MNLISDVKNDGKQLALMVVLCNLIMDFEGPEHETFLEYSKFEMTSLIKSLFGIEHSEQTLEQALWIVHMIID